MPDDQSSGAAALTSAGMTAEGVFGQRLETLNVTGTPTLLLLDDRGRVKQAWVGELSAQGEKEVPPQRNSHSWSKPHSESRAVIRVERGT